MNDICRVNRVHSFSVPWWYVGRQLQLARAGSGKEVILSPSPLVLATALADVGNRGSTFNMRLKSSITLTEPLTSGRHYLEALELRMPVCTFPFVAIYPICSCKLLLSNKIMKTYQLEKSTASHCDAGPGIDPDPDPDPDPQSQGAHPNGKGAPNHSPDLPCPVGIDLHPDIFDAVELRQGKRSRDATVIRRFRELPTADIATWALEHLDPSKNLLIIESTSNTIDCVLTLVDAGFSCVVVESNQVSKIAEAFIDDDQIAAERVARCYLTGFATVVWVPDEKTTERREILHAYDRSVTDHVRAINELKSFLTKRNIRPGKRNLHLDKNRKWVESQLEEKQLTPNQLVILESLFTSLHTAKANRDLFYQTICREMLTEQQMLTSLRVIGIGIINAFAIVAIVGDINRFANAKKLVSYFGL